MVVEIQSRMKTSEDFYLFIFFFDLLDRANGCWMNHFSSLKYSRDGVFFFFFSFLSLVEVVICMMQYTGCLLQREIYETSMFSTHSDS